MKFGVRECADVVLRAKSTQVIGNKIFYKNEPVCYFDTLKTSTFEGAASTVYAQGGRGNARLMSWDGERTVTFTMEDALISPIGLSILTGAGLFDASSTKPVIQHVTEIVSYDSAGLTLSKEPYQDNKDCSIFVMGLDSNGEVITEPYYYIYNASNSGESTNAYSITLASGSFGGKTYNGASTETSTTLTNNPIGLASCSNVLVDYYVKHEEAAMQINISPEKFGGTFYLEASTLWRDQGSGQDLPAEFIIPSCKVQSNFSFTLSSSGDPSSFTFTMDAFPDFTRWDGKNKVLASIQVIGATLDNEKVQYRSETWSQDDVIDGKVTTYKTTGD